MPKPKPESPEWGPNLPEHPKGAKGATVPIEGWSHEERTKYYLDSINREHNPKHPLLYADFDFGWCDAKSMEVLTLAIAYMSGGVSGGFFREKARAILPHGDVLNLQRNLEFVAGLIAEWEKNNP